MFGLIGKRKLGLAKNKDHNISLQNADKQWIYAKC